MHIKLIEHFLQHPEIGKDECLQFLVNMWPTIRARLVKYPGQVN